MNIKVTVLLQQVIINMVHPKSLTLIQIENNTAAGFVIEKKLQDYSVTVNIHFHWILDGNHQTKFLIYWKPGVHKKLIIF